MTALNVYVRDTEIFGYSDTEISEKDNEITVHSYYQDKFIHIPRLDTVFAYRGSIGLATLISSKIFYDKKILSGQVSSIIENLIIETVKEHPQVLDKYFDLWVFEAVNLKIITTRYETPDYKKQIIPAGKGIQLPEVPGYNMDHSPEYNLKLMRDQKKIPNTGIDGTCHGWTFAFINGRPAFSTINLGSL